MKTLRDQVLEFHRAFGQPIVESPSLPSDERFRLRLRLMSEEYVEMLEAAGADPKLLPILRHVIADIVDGARSLEANLPELADAMADLDYVVEGTRIELGIDGGPVAAEVHRANMAKLWDGEARKRDDGKILKPPGWTPPDVEGELRKQGWAAR